MAVRAPSTATWWIFFSVGDRLIYEKYFNLLETIIVDGILGEVGEVGVVQYYLCVHKSIKNIFLEKLEQIESNGFHQ